MYGDILPCERPVHLAPDTEEPHDNQAFYDTIEESADKLWLHTNELANKCLARGESKGMMAVLGSVAATRNKLWLYNERMSLNEKPKPFAKTYSKERVHFIRHGKRLWEPPTISDVLKVQTFANLN